MVDLGGRGGAAEKMSPRTSKSELAPVEAGVSVVVMPVMKVIKS